MKKIVRKISFLLLLLPACMPVVFTMLFLLKQQIIRHEMKEKLEEQILHTVVMPKKKVVWVKYNHEIMIEGRMFDVKSFSEKDGLVFFHGLFDEEETALNELLEKGKNEDGKNQLTDLIQWLSSPGIIASADFNIVANHTKAFCKPILQNIPSPFINPSSPPPQAA